MVKPLVALAGVKKLHRLGGAVVHALADVNLTIRRGEFVAVTGPSGSGKSTLLSILGGLDRPSRGQYLLDGEDVLALTVSKLPSSGTNALDWCSKTSICCRD